MAKRKPFVIDGEVREVKADAKLAEVVAPDVQSVVTHSGALIPRSEFMRVPVPEGFETNLSAINKGGPSAVNTRCLSMLAAALIAATGLTASANAGGLGKAAGRAAVSRMLAKEAARDAASPAVALRRGQSLSRYATRQEAAAEAKQGLRAGQHLAGPSESRQLLSAEAASERYGLAHKTPEVRETWYVPKGIPARVNPVWGGATDATEATLTRPLPAKNLTRIESLPAGR